VYERTNIHMLWNQVYKHCAPCLNYFSSSGPGWCNVPQQLMCRENKRFENPSYIVSYNLSCCMFLTAKILGLLPQIMAYQTL